MTAARGGGKRQLYPTYTPRLTLWTLPKIPAKLKALPSSGWSRAASKGGSIATVLTNAGVDYH